MVVIGVDPGSKKYGVATYVDGNLETLDNFNIVEFFNMLKSKVWPSSALFVVEDVRANTFQYSRTLKAYSGKTKLQCMKIGFKMGQGPGMCMLAQAHIELIILHSGYSFINQKPVRGNWAENKAQFERVTGWKARSNRDTRSAAFLAYLNLNRA